MKIILTESKTLNGHENDGRFSSGETPNQNPTPPKGPYNSKSASAPALNVLKLQGPKRNDYSLVLSKPTKPTHFRPNRPLKPSKPTIYGLLRSYQERSRLVRCVGARKLGGKNGPTIACNRTKRDTEASRDVGKETWWSPRVKNLRGFARA